MPGPVKKFNAGAIQVAIWQNEGKEGAQYNTISIDRRYKDKNEQWKSSNSLRINDVPKAVVTLQKAYEYLILKETATAEVETLENVI